MQNSNRILGGRKAKQEGSGFESFMDRQATKQGYVVIHIPDGCRQISKHKIIRVPSPFDRIYVKENIDIFCDLKSYGKSSLSHSDCAKFIDQVILLNRLELQRKFAGFIVYFRPSEKIVFLSSSKMLSLAPGSSLGVNDGILLGNLFNVNLDKIVT